MAHERFSGGDSYGDDDDRIPGISDEELKALESERSVMEETENQMASRLMRQALIGATQSLTKLALYSANERIRMSAAQYIIERNMGRVQDQPPAPVDDPLADLMADVVSEIDDDALEKLAAQVAVGSETNETSNREATDEGES